VPTRSVGGSHFRPEVRRLTLTQLSADVSESLAALVLSFRAARLVERAASLATRTRGLLTFRSARRMGRSARLVLIGYVSGLSRQAGLLTRKVLHGTSVAELPIERPTRFKLVANLKTASALGITLPTSILLSADEVIE
jgi:hypothetical protein